MKKEEKSRLIKMLVYALLVIVITVMGFATGLIHTEDISAMLSVSGVSLLKLVIVVLGILLIENAVVFILGFFKPKSHRARSILSLTCSLIKYIAFIVIFCWGLTILGVNIGTIVASVGVLALIVGFSAESLIADVVTGTFMLLENQYNVGDIVEVNGFRGTVTSIGIRTTCITDTGDNVKIINNSEMKNILNRSDNLSRAVSDIAIPYETDIEKLEGELPKLLEEIYNAHTDTMQNVPQYLGVQELQDSGILLRFVVEVSEKNIFSAMRTLNHDLLLGFRRLGVECPFPQLDVHNR
ncbi:MAG: mechanosensitive ion channel family protein [Lachnospiraceae bacterium]